MMQWQQAAAPNQSRDEITRVNKQYSRAYCVASNFSPSPQYSTLYCNIDFVFDYFSQSQAKSSILSKFKIIRLRYDVEYTNSLNVFLAVIFSSYKKITNTKVSSDLQTL